MKLQLWQFLMVVTWVAMILGVSFSSQLPIDIRGGGAMVLLGFVVGSMLIVGYGYLIFTRDVDAGG